MDQHAVFFEAMNIWNSANEVYEALSNKPGTDQMRSELLDCMKRACLIEQLCVNENERLAMEAAKAING